MTMGFQVFTEPDANGAFPNFYVIKLRFGWICDVCGKEIEDPREGSVDYSCLEPGEAIKNKKMNKLFNENRPEKDYLDYIVYHNKTCTPKKTHRYWCTLENLVSQLNLPLTKPRSHVK
tara:strand:- start:210 stop:563 length:354 start_codon:yes stop_codon:yes gene_type:complete